MHKRTSQTNYLQASTLRSVVKVRATRKHKHKRNFVASPSPLQPPDQPDIVEKEDRLQNIMSRVALKKSHEAPWTIERVVRFINSLGFREIILDTEPAILAFTIRPADACKSGSREQKMQCKETNCRARREHSDAAAWHHQHNQMPHSMLRTRGTKRRLPSYRLAEPTGTILSRCQKERDGKTSFRRGHRKKTTTQDFVPFDEKVLVRQTPTELTHTMNPGYNFGMCF